MAGISVCRNQDLANVFYRLHLIEAYGTGMGKIMRAYKSIAEKPSIETTKNTFKIILPNINAKYEMRNFSVPKAESITSSAAGAEEILSDEERVLEYARSHGAITRNKHNIRTLIREKIDDRLIMLIQFCHPSAPNLFPFKIEI